MAADDQTCVLIQHILRMGKFTDRVPKSCFGEASLPMQFPFTAGSFESNFIDLTKKVISQLSPLNYVRCYVNRRLPYTLVCLCLHKQSLPSGVRARSSFIRPSPLPLLPLAPPSVPLVLLVLSFCASCDHFVWHQKVEQAEQVGQYNTLYEAYLITTGHINQQ